MVRYHRLQFGFGSAYMAALSVLKAFRISCVLGIGNFGKRFDTERSPGVAAVIYTWTALVGLRWPNG